MKCLLMIFLQWLCFNGVNMKIKTICTTVVVLVGLMSSACTTTQSTQKPTKLNADSCASANWQQLGELDGQQGRYPYEFARYEKRCGAVGDKRATWEAGRQKGLEQYCTKANAFSLGQRGLNFNQVCPENGLLELQQSYALGYQRYYQEQRLVAPWQWQFGAYPYFW